MKSAHICRSISKCLGWTTDGWGLTIENGNVGGSKFVESVYDWWLKIEVIRLRSFPGKEFICMPLGEDKN